MDIDVSTWRAPDGFPVACSFLTRPPQHMDAVVNAMVFVHHSSYFLDFIQHFFKLYNKKRSELEEEQLHINVGLNKIAETVAQVEEIQKSQVKSDEPESKNIEANEKLKQMVKDQQEAERQKQQSIEIIKQTKDIAVKRSEVMKDLERVELAVMDAQNDVKNIKKQHLVEVRTMANPPAIIRMALEGICTLL